MNLRKLLKLTAPIVAVLLVAIVASSVLPAKAQAISATEFQPGRIIDDAVFYNSNAFPDVQAVQDFISSHTPACDTWGTQPSGYGNLTRAQYAQQIQGWAGPPYVCLQNYHENSSTGQTSYEMGGGAFAGGKSAAQIIYDAAQQYGINPQVLLVMLKKESPGPLFSDSWPLKTQYRYAMGYACPDSGPNYSASCVQSKAGLYNQVTLAAWQLRQYANNISQYNYQPGRWNYIQYNPSPNCGGQNVYIENVATASLYIYTPYVPNQGALAAYPGTASCGAYGNRNFYMFFREWFGSTYGSVQINSPLKISTTSNGTGVFTSKELKFSFTIKNATTSRQDIGDMVIIARDSSGNNYDFGRKNVVLAPGETYEYSQTQTFSNESEYTFSIGNFRQSVGWSADYPSSATDNLQRTSTVFIQAAPTVTQVPSITEETARSGRSVSAVFGVKNNSSRALPLGKIGLAIRGPQNQNYDLAYDNVASIAPGATYQYSKTLKPEVTGNYKLSISSTPDGGATWMNENFFSNLGLSANSTIKVKPGLVISRGMSQAGDYKAFQKVSISYDITNYTDTTVTLEKTGVFIRSPSGVNYDPRWDTPTIGARANYTYAVDFYPDTAGRWIIWVGGQRAGNWINNIAPIESGLSENYITVGQNPVLSSNVSLDESVLRTGRATQASFSIKNDGDMAVKVELVGLSVKSDNGDNLDPGWESPIIQPHSTYVYTKNIKPAKTGKVTVSIGGKKNGEWVSNPVYIESTAGFNSTTTATVQPGVTLTRGITFSGQYSVGLRNMSLEVTNYTDNPVNIGKIGIAVRDPSNKNYDSLWEDFVIPARSTKQHIVGVPFDKPGVWSAQVGNYNGEWNSTNPPSENPDINRQLKLTIQ